MNLIIYPKNVVRYSGIFDWSVFTRLHTEAEQRRQRLAVVDDKTDLRSIRWGLRHAKYHRTRPSTTAGVTAAFCLPLFFLYIHHNKQRCEIALQPGPILQRYDIKNDELTLAARTVPAGWDAVHLPELMVVQTVE